ncbi:MAG: type II toxin-antitoxin system RelE/ParE family toxin [Flavobacteriales bacterium]|nr:type II toxin-antitoxin system RelE/ParE family toxin [Flavobacteriales bacterium]
MRADVAELIEGLTHDPLQGTALGRDCYKVRMAVRSKGKGRSGGTRVITCVKVVRRTVILLTIYDKSETGDISNKELAKLVEMFT